MLASVYNGRTAAPPACNFCFADITCDLSIWIQCCWRLCRPLVVQKRLRGLGDKVLALEFGDRKLARDSDFTARSSFTNPRIRGFPSKVRLLEMRSPTPARLPGPT